MRKRNKIIIILGQTSTGKSSFAVEIAKKINGEIISADSRQVYKGMNLGTGKITKKEMRGIPHHLLDIISPKKVFSVNDFQKIANRKITEIIKKNNIPIVCGGTGFYIDILINGTNLPKVPPNKNLRKSLDQLNLIKLTSCLKKLDPRRAKSIDKNNKVRLIRAIEIVEYLGKVPAIKKTRPKYKFIKIGLAVPQENLKNKIYTRLLSRIKKGMLKEINSLHKIGVSWKRMDTLGLEYRYGALYLQNKISKEKMIEELNIKIWQFAKKQKTWFKRDKNIIWIDPSKKNNKFIIFKKIEKFLDTN